MLKTVRRIACAVAALCFCAIVTSCGKEEDVYKRQAMDDDFNTADAITAIYELVKFINVKINESFSKKSAFAAKNMIKELCNVLGVLQLSLIHI